jgi:hypothetical protein
MMEISRVKLANNTRKKNDMKSQYHFKKKEKFDQEEKREREREEKMLWKVRPVTGPIKTKEL